MVKRKGFTPLEIDIPDWDNRRFLTGFTLIELLVVIAIIASITDFIIPQLFTLYAGLNFREYYSLSIILLT